MSNSNGNGGNGNGDLTRDERLQIMLTPEELLALDNFRFKQRMPSRAAAVRDLLRLGLASVGIEPATPGIKSGKFGVLDGSMKLPLEPTPRNKSR
jgi:hypothetical protein